MGEIQRYDTPESAERWTNPQPIPAFYSSGKWVLYADHAAAIAAKDAEVERLQYAVNRTRALDDGWDPEPLEDDTPMSRYDVEELIERANKLRGDREGDPIEVGQLAPYEVIASRSEFAAYASEIRRCWVELARLRKIEAAARALVSAKDEFASWDEDQQSRDEISHLMHAIAPARQALRAALAEGGES